MASVVNEGFGATPPAVLTAPSDTMVRIIASSPGSRVDILTINPSSVQAAGAPVATKFLAVFVVRGQPTLGVGPVGTLLPPVTPSTGASVGLPGVGDLQGTELLHACYVSVANQGIPLQFERGELMATNGQKLAVIVAAVVDGTTTPPTLRSDPVTLSVNGTSENLDTSLSAGVSVATGVSRSLPRWDVPLPE